MTYIIFFAGIIVGALSTRTIAIYMRKKPDGKFCINLSNPDKDVYSLELDTPLSEVPKKNTLVLSVKISQENQSI